VVIPIDFAPQRAHQLAIGRVGVVETERDLPQLARLDLVDVLSLLPAALVALNFLSQDRIAVSAAGTSFALMSPSE